MNSTEPEVLIKSVRIENFKSIKNLEIECKKVNVFIGEPNTGKSNILEAIVGLPSMFHYSYDFDNPPEAFVRYEKPKDIFYDNDLENEIKVKFEMSKLSFQVVIRFRNGTYEFGVDPDITPFMSFPPSSITKYSFDNIAKDFKFYRFREPGRFDRKDSEFLLPPDGRNLPVVYLINKNLKSILKNILKKFGLKLMIDPDTNEIKVVKELEDIFIAYPYQSLSDTFKHLMFNLSAVITNRGSVISLEEPEARAFPFYTKYLAELIALDDSNQYFITTHNPYFLLTIVEKTPKKDLAVFVTFYEDYKTKLKKLSERKLQEVLDLGTSAFFNLASLMEG